MTGSPGQQRGLMQVLRAVLTRDALFMLGTSCISAFFLLAFFTNTPLGEHLALNCPGDHLFAACSAAMCVAALLLIPTAKHVSYCKGLLFASAASLAAGMGLVLYFWKAGAQFEPMLLGACLCGIGGLYCLLAIVIRVTNLEQKEALVLMLSSSVIATLACIILGGPLSESSALACFVLPLAGCALMMADCTLLVRNGATREQMSLGSPRCATSSKEQEEDKELGIFEAGARLGVKKKSSHIVLLLAAGFFWTNLGLVRVLSSPLSIVHDAMLQTVVFTAMLACMLVLGLLVVFSRRSLGMELAAGFLCLFFAVIYLVMYFDFQSAILGGISFGLALAVEQIIECCCLSLGLSCLRRSKALPLVALLLALRGLGWALGIEFGSLCCYLSQGNIPLFVPLLLLTVFASFSLTIAIERPATVLVEIVGENLPVSESIDPREQRCKLLAERAGLSPREQEVLILLAQGNDRASIAKQLYLSLGSINTYASRVYSKTGVHSRQELIDLVNKESL